MSIFQSIVLDLFLTQPGVSEQPIETWTQRILFHILFQWGMHYQGRFKHLTYS